jgi:uncharacterized membrane protein
MPHSALVAFLVLAVVVVLVAPVPVLGRFLVVLLGGLAVVMVVQYAQAKQAVRA